MLKKIGVLVAAAFILVGCSPINSGYITDKKHHEAYNYMTQQCASFNSKGICSVWVPIWHHVDESFSFDLRNDNGDTGWVYVDISEFEKYKIGDYYGEKK